jgi:transcriptional regulator with GAF, ATPase, and Fis domain
MESSSDSRFDPNFAASLLLDIAHEQSLEHLMEKLVRAQLRRRAIARVEFWLIEKGDICAVCPQRPNCPNQARCLHLAAGGNNSLEDAGEQGSFFHNTDARIPLGVGVIGRIAATGEQIVLLDLDKEPGELSRLEGMRREQIREFAGTAISFKGEILGVITNFARVTLPDELRVWRQIFADHVGSAITSARAFEEIHRLKAQLEMQNAYLETEVVEAKAFGGLVGQSAPLRHILSQIELVAPTDASVLILGETGTGKELVAREIHRRSRRHDKPLIRVNCASIPRELYESEFFGHARGAFTGAIKDRAGRFETAEGGTIFLDEIGEVPPELQSKLLRVLQEKRYERVGEDRTRVADVRIMGATNRDLKKEVAAGRFREDLYYRLNVFPIHVPALRERVDDIELLAKHFIELSVKDLRCAKPRLTRAGIIKLQSYNWPGNIRELRNVIERGVIISRGGALDFDLPLTDDPPRPSSCPPGSGTQGGAELFTEAEMRRRERENLAAVLEKTGWKIKGPGGAAEFLGLKHTTLFARLKKMGLEKPSPQ